MNTPDLLSLLADGLGLQRLDLNPDGACAVRLQDGIDLDIQVLEHCEEVRLTLPVGEPDPGRCHEVLAEALLANALLASMSSRHLAWEGSSQRLVLCQTLRFDQVSPSLLRQDLDEFTAACRALRRQLQQDGVFQP